MTKFLWTQRANFGPSPRSSSGMAYDSNCGRTVLFGGSGDPSGGDALGDTWEWNGAFWTQLQDIGPAPRIASAMAYDSARKVSVLFGGTEATFPATYLGDTWQWDGADWTQVSESGPAARTNHAVAFDSSRDRLVLFGGETSEQTLSDTWEFDGESWTQQEDTGPPPRGSHTMAYDARAASSCLGAWLAAQCLATLGHGTARNGLVR